MGEESMDPEEIQEIGVFLLLAIVMLMITKGGAGAYQVLIDYLLMGLFVTGIAIIVCGVFLTERAKELMKK